jgi:hypothetical protein
MQRFTGFLSNRLKAIFFDLTEDQMVVSPVVEAGVVGGRLFEPRKEKWFKSLLAASLHQSRLHVSLGRSQYV